MGLLVEIERDTGVLIIICIMLDFTWRLSESMTITYKLYVPDELGENVYPG